MYTLKKTFSDIKTLHSNSNKLVLAQKHKDSKDTKLIFLDKSNLSELSYLNTELEIDSIGVLGEKSYVVREGVYGKLGIVNYDSENKLSLSNLLPDYSCKNNPHFIQNCSVHVIEQNSSPRKNHLYHLTENKFTKVIEAGILEYNFGCAFGNSRQKKELSFYDVKEGELKWKFDYSKYITQEDYPQFDILTIHLNQLICLVDQNKIVIINADNGTVEQEIDSVLDIDGKEIKEFELPHFNAIKNNVIILSSGILFIEFDIQTKKITIKKYFAPITDILSAEIFIRQMNVYNDLMYFTSENKKTKTYHTVGVLNTNTLEVMWTFDLNLAKTVILNKAPVVDENYLYITDSANSLHIFEKEK